MVRDRFFCTTECVARPSAGLDRCHLCEIFAADGHAAQALAGGSEDRVAYRGSDDRETGFADARRSLGARHDVYLDPRRLVDARHCVIVEIGLLHAPAIDGDGVV
jgi:hypothetical protein